MRINSEFETFAAKSFKIENLGEIILEYLPTKNGQKTRKISWYGRQKQASSGELKKEMP